MIIGHDNYQDQLYWSILLYSIIILIFDLHFNYDLISFYCEFEVKFRWGGEECQTWYFSAWVPIHSLEPYPYL